MKLNPWCFALAFATSTFLSCAETSMAGSLTGSINGYASGYRDISNPYADPSDPNYNSHSSYTNVPATLTFWIWEVNGQYQSRFMVLGYDYQSMSGDPDGAYIHESLPDRPGASAGGGVNFLDHESTEGGSFSIYDPTGAYIASGGTADPLGVTAEANVAIGGYSYDGFYMEGLDFSTSPMINRSVPEPASCMLLAIGTLGLMVRKYGMKMR
jgi:hypothetical protein